MSSIASNYIRSLKQTEKNRESIIRRLKAKSTHQQFGEDMRYFFRDGSQIVYRTVLDDYQLFKGC